MGRHLQATIAACLPGMARAGTSCKEDEITGPAEAGSPARGGADLASSASTNLAIQYLSLGLNHTCGITPNQRSYCWGRNSDGQLGTGSPSWRTSRPVAVVGGLSFIQLSVNEKHSCGVTSNHIAYCWGWNRDGRLGDGTLTNRAAPVRVAGGLQFTQVRTGWDHTCALTPLNQA